jgi:hypothetical protein
MKAIAVNTEHTLTISFKELEVLRQVMFDALHSDDLSQGSEEVLSSMLRELNKVLGYTDTKVRNELLQINSIY